MGFIDFAAYFPLPFMLIENKEISETQASQSINSTLAAESIGHINVLLKKDILTGSDN